MLWVCLIALAAPCIPARAAYIAPPVNPGPSPEVLAENTAPLTEIGRIRIENRPGGVIAVTANGGWRPVGSVLRYTTKIDRNSFTASAWGRPGTVVATAVNALHVKVGQNEKLDRGMDFSLLPVEFAPGSREPFETRSPDASIYTDIPAGTCIFGGDYSPLVGNPVFIERDGKLEPLTPDYVPALGDVVVISIRRPGPYPSQIVFENRFQGQIFLEYPDGYCKPIGTVLRPVMGVGRFPGTLYASIGRLRANHPGVIDVSTSLIGEVGGFQIVPAGHAMSPETSYVRLLTQWMVVGPLDSRDPTWEGVVPLFYQYLRPKYDAADLYAEDWDVRLLGRFLVEVKRDGRWQAMPHLGIGASPDAPLPEWAGSALQDVQAIRILFPLDEDSRPQ